MADQHSLPVGTWPHHAIRNNGPDDLVLERLKLRELAEGWPCYRDSCEWENFESVFHKDAHVYTTWSGRTPFADFIRSSKAGMDNGVFIMHRCHGTTTDITPDGTRAVTKMKACITQRFVVEDDVEIDVEADCRFCFFFEKEDGKWGARLVRHWYEKDRIVPVIPGRLPTIDLGKLGTYPAGYKCLAYFQELTMGATVARDMPGHRRHAGTPAGEKHDLLYRMGHDWLLGKDLGDLEV